MYLVLLTDSHMDSYYLFICRWTDRQTDRQPSRNYIVYYYLLNYLQTDKLKSIFVVFSHGLKISLHPILDQLNTQSMLSRHLENSHEDSQSIY